MTHNEKVLALLSDGKAHSHHELYSLRVIAHSRIANLRQQGHVIECWREDDLYLYRLLGGAEGNGTGQETARDDGLSLTALRFSEQAAPPQGAPSPAAACSPIQLELETESRFGSGLGESYASGESRAA